jgi:cytochrome c oxidase subunit 4
MTERPVSPRIYYAVFATLVILTLVTTGVAFIDLGILNPVVAITIAVGKASLVVLFFMHVRYRARLTGVVLGAGILWLAFLIAFTLSDVATRDWIPVPLPWIAGTAAQNGRMP